MLTIDKPEINEPARSAPVPPPSTARARRIRYSDCRKRRTEWLWPARVPLGRLTLLVGEPGLGKGSVTADLAARVSRGAVWPDDHVAASLRDARAVDDGSPVGEMGNPSRVADASLGETRLRGRVIVIAAEHERDDVVPARLAAAGADLEKICTIGPAANESEVFEDEGAYDDEFAEPLTMKEQLEGIEAALRESPDCKLVVIDPLEAMLEGERALSRVMMQPLVRALSTIARKYRVAIVATADLNLRASLQSVDRLTRVFRSGCSGTRVLGVFRDPNASGQSLIVPLEVNFAAEQAALSFRLSGGTSGGTGKRSLPVEAPGDVESLNSAQHWQTALASGTHDSATQVVEWGAEVPTSLEKLLTRARFNGVEQTYRDAQDYVTTRLREILSDGPFDRSDLVYKALGNQHQIYRAAEQLGVIKVKASYKDGWIWMLPEHHAAWQEKQAARAAKQRERKTEKQRERRAEERTAVREIVEEEVSQEITHRTEGAKQIDNGAPKGSGVGVEQWSPLQNPSTPTPTPDPVRNPPRELPAQRPDKPRWHTREFIVGGRKLTVETSAAMDEAEREVATQQLLKQEADYQRDAEQAEAKMREAGEWEEEWEVDSS